MLGDGNMHPRDRIGIIALDPGGTTGWSVSRFEYGDLSTIRANSRDCFEMRWGQFTGSENGQADDICDLVDKGRNSDRIDYLILLIEDFILRQKRKDRDLLSPVRLTAKVEWANWMWWGLPLIKQQPSLAKTSINDARLRSWDAWAIGEEHARDANRHNITLVRRFQQKPSLLWKVIHGCF